MFAVVVTGLTSIAVSCVVIAWIISKTAAPDSKARRHVSHLIHFAIGLVVVEVIILVFQHYEGQQGTKDIVRHTDDAKNEIIDTFSGAFDDERFYKKLKETAGTDEIAKAVVEAVLVPGLYYSDFLVTASLEYDSTLALALREEWLRITVDYEVTMVNPTDREIRETREITFFSLASPPQDVITRPPFQIESFSYRVFDRHENERETFRKDLKKEEILSSSVDSPRHQTVREDLIVGAGDRGVLRITTVGYERMEGDLSVEAVLKTERMVVTTTFPDHSFISKVHYSHPHRHLPAVCNTRTLSPRQMSAEINGGLLPFQGMTLTWSRNEDAITTK